MQLVCWGAGIAMISLKSQNIAQKAFLEMTVYLCPLKRVLMCSMKRGWGHCKPLQLHISSSFSPNEGGKGSGCGAILQKGTTEVEHSDYAGDAQRGADGQE